MRWELVFIVGSIIFAIATYVGAIVWVLWDVLFPACARGRDSMSVEIEQLLAAERRKA
jgi:hypothetical protein